MDGIYNHDARKINEILKEKTVDVTITSPPYFDMKDYGYKEQIGFGQNYKQYLADLKIVFKNVYDCTKDTGTLWVIIDTLRKDNEVITLPFDFSNTIKETGWKLQEIIIWAKDRTVPWIHQGQMRNLFEYILLFSKTDKYNFFIDEVRDFETLKKWWVKYPERYNPKGKTPDAVWHFDIPTQGSWGSGYIKHFCPLPEEMIGQILKISTKEGGVVLDPFAGSGAVLAKAANMKRNYVGFELNKSYIEMFQKYLKETGDKKNKTYLNKSSKSLSQEEFNDLILDLRALKYAKLIYKNLPVPFAGKIKNILVSKKKGAATQRNALSVVEYCFLLETKTNKQAFLLAVEKISKERPLSKFGIQPEFNAELRINLFQDRLGDTRQLFTYAGKVTHKYKNKIKANQFPTITKSEVILSTIQVDLNEKDYE
jgi:DNA modification methylase